MQVALAARDTSKLTDLVDETGALALSCDASRADEVNALFERLSKRSALLTLLLPIRVAVIARQSKPSHRGRQA
jgi:NADP-dependent 3-hydroxy acid dehydrogenase YdfG